MLSPSSWSDDMQLKCVPSHSIQFAAHSMQRHPRIQLSLRWMPHRWNEKSFAWKEERQTNCKWNWIKTTLTSTHTQPLKISIKFLLSFDWARTSSQNHTRSYWFCRSFVRLFVCLLFFLFLFFLLIFVFIMRERKFKLAIESIQFDGHKINQKDRFNSQTKM